jgi:hypothetical protein
MLLCEKSVHSRKTMHSLVVCMCAGWTNSHEFFTCLSKKHVPLLFIPCNNYSIRDGIPKYVSIVINEPMLGIEDPDSIIFFKVLTGVYPPIFEAIKSINLLPHKDFLTKQTHLKI